jgi:hypothetical protein
LLISGFSHSPRDVAEDPEAPVSVIENTYNAINQISQARCETLSAERLLPGLVTSIGLDLPGNFMEGNELCRCVAIFPT